MDNFRNARLAQLVEHLTLNQGVQGSSPWSRTLSTVFADIRAVGTVFSFARWHEPCIKIYTYRSSELAHRER